MLKRVCEKQIVFYFMSRQNLWR